MRTQHIARAILLSCLVFLLSGCQVFSPVGNFIGQRYTNVASYFNTYYNASKMFDEAETEVLTGMQAAREKSAKGQVAPYVLSSTARQKFTNSIEKNSKLLSYYPSSKFVDNALLMIGKAYFYLEEDLKAERKFLELISQYPESNLIPETKLWYGKSLFRQKRNAEGLQLLSTLYTDALNNKDHDDAGRAALAIGDYYFAQADYNGALQSYAQSVAELSDDEQNARTQFQIGICFTMLDQTDAARDAFRTVGNFNPDYNTSFQAAVYESRMLAKEKKFEQALELLFTKLDDGKYTEYYATAHREVGNVYAQQGNITEAVEQYRYVDTAFARTDDAARSMYALGSLYENTLFQYDSARVFYDKAKLECPSSDITPEAAKRSEMFGKYMVLKRDLANYDTLMMDTIHPRKLKMDSASVAKRDSIHRVDSLTALKKTVPLPGTIFGMRKDTASIRTDTGSAARSAAELAAKLRADSAAHAASVPPLTAAARDSIAKADSIASLTAKARILDSLSRQVARTKFELAGVLYLEMNHSDSALVYYDAVIHSTKDSSLAARALFTMAEIYASSDSLSRTKTDSLYRKIIDIAPRSSYAAEARKILHLPEVREERDSAEVEFWTAERFMDTGKPTEAIPVLQALAAAYPKSLYAPKALYTVGWIYENALTANDSAESAYRRLTDKYPGCVYATSVQPKLFEIANARREAEAKAAAEKAAADKAEADRQKAQQEKETKAKAEAAQQKPATPVMPPAAQTADSLRRMSAPDSAAMKHGVPPARTDADSVQRRWRPVPRGDEPENAQTHSRRDSTAQPRRFPGRQQLPPVNAPADTAGKNTVHPIE